MTEVELTLRACSVEKAARSIGVGRTLMFSLMRSEPELRPIHIGRRSLITIDGIDAFLKRKLRERDERGDD